MMGLFVLAAAQVIQRLPPVAVPPPQPAPVTRVGQAGEVVQVQMLPDLVVKAIRIEGDSTMHVLVANEGTAPATSFGVSGNARVGGTWARPGSPGSITGLAAGTSQWIELSGFVAPSGGTPVELSKADMVAAEADPIPIDISAFDPLRKFGGSSSGSTCSTKHGCVLELNESNNRLELAGAAIVRGKPE